MRVWTGAFAEAVEDDRLWVSLEGGLPVDLAVALPRPVGPHIEGLPSDAHGFVPVDDYGRVPDVPDVYAAGDMTTRRLKQGGLATQQADAAAAAIAAAAGADVELEAYRPVLRAMLLTSGSPRYLRRAAHETGEAADEPPVVAAAQDRGARARALPRRPPGASRRAPASWRRTASRSQSTSVSPELSTLMRRPSSAATTSRTSRSGVVVSSARARGRRPRAAAGPTRGARRARRASRAARPAGGRARPRSRARR